MPLYLRDERSHTFLFLAIIVLVIALTATGCSGRRAEQYRQQGDTYFRLQNYAEAEAAYRRAIQADASNMPAKLGLGRCLNAKGRQDEALSLFQEIMISAPEMDLAYLEAANLMMIRDASGEAFDIAKRLEEVNAELGGILHAALLLQTGETESGVALLEGLQDQYPDSMLLRGHLANAYLSVGEAQKAESELEAAMAAMPGPATGIRMLLAETMAAQNRIDAFIEKQDPNNLQDIDQAMVLAHAFIQDNREEEAEEILRQVLSNNPSHGWASFVMGSYLVDKGRNADAVSFLQTAVLGLPWEAAVRRDAAAAHREPGAVSAAPPARETTTALPTPAVPAPVASAAEDWQTLWRQAALRRLIEERARFQAEAGGHFHETMVLAAFFRGSGALAEEFARELPTDSPLHAYLKALRSQEPQEAINALEPWNNQEGMLRLLAMNAVGYAMAISGARGQAVQVFSACAEQYPENGVSLLNLAQVFRAANMPQFASRALGRLTAIYPETSKRISYTSMSFANRACRKKRDRPRKLCMPYSRNREKRPFPYAAFMWTARS